MYQFSFSSTIEVFIHRLFCSKWIFSQALFSQVISCFWKIQGHLQDLENELVTFQDVWEP